MANPNDDGIARMIREALVPNCVRRAVETLRQKNATTTIIDPSGDALAIGVTYDPSDAERVVFLVFDRKCAYFGLQPLEAWALSDQLRAVATRANGGRPPA